MAGPNLAREMADSATKLTYDDLLALPDDGLRHELIDGEHFVTAAPNTRHQLVLQNLNHALHSFVRAHALGRVFFAPYDVVFTPRDVAEPDLMFFGTARLSILTAANAQGAPDLLVEVLSPSSRRRDEVLKRDLYEREGVTEYWVVDPDAETVKVFRNTGDRRFGRPQLLSLRDADALTTPLLPGFELSLVEVFAE